MKIVYGKQALKYLKTLDRITKSRVVNGIDGLPMFGDIKMIKGDWTGYRLRIGNLRVIYEINDDIIYIARICPRGQVYKRL